MMRPTFRVRTMILAVALVGVACGVALDFVADGRRGAYRDRAESFAYGEADLVEQIAENLARARKVEAEGSDGARRASQLRSEAERLARLAAWHVKMERLYERAADHPWEPLAPAPPPP